MLYVILKETEMEIEDEVDLMMSTDIVTAQMSTKSITFSRAQSGWIFRQDKKVWKFYTKYPLSFLVQYFLPILYYFLIFIT